MTCSTGGIGSGLRRHATERCLELTETRLDACLAPPGEKDEGNESGPHQKVRGDEQMLRTRSFRAALHGHELGRALLRRESGMRGGWIGHRQDSSCSYSSAMTSSSASDKVADSSDRRVRSQMRRTASRVIATKPTIKVSFMAG